MDSWRRASVPHTDAGGTALFATRGSLRDQQRGKLAKVDDTTTSNASMTMPVRLLLLFGVVGLVLSELLSWNVAPLVAAASKGPVHVVLAVAAAVVGYTFMFAVTLDLLHRWGVDDWPGVVLGGSVYGLLNEGVFGSTVFQPGFGPRVLGVWPVRMAYPALSWHPLIDFGLGVFVVSRLCGGIPALLERRLRGTDALAAAVAGGAFAATSRLPWVRQALGGGELPPWVQAFGLLAGAILVHAALLAAPVGPARGTITSVLSPRARVAAWAVVGAVLMARAVSLPTKLAVVPFLTVVAAHLLVLRLHANVRQKPAGGHSIVEACAGLHTRPNLVKLVALQGIAGIAYLFVRTVTALPAMQVIARSAGLLLVLAAMAFAALFPAAMLIRAVAARRRLARSNQQQ